MTSGRIEPFRALRYDERVAGRLASLVAPPYDIIDAERQAELYARSPYNVVRLELSRDADRYQSSARMLHKWIAEGILVRAERPAIYLYTQIFNRDRRRYRRDGFVARVRLEEFACDRIMPHERTFPAPKQDRLRLLTATETNLSSIFGLYSGSHPELDALRESLKSAPPAVEFTDDLGIANELRPIEDSAQIAAIQRALEPTRVLIADGHHRYETALEYRRRRRAAEGNGAATRPYDYIMMTLVSCDDPGLVILPTHRLLRGVAPQALAAFETRAREFFDVQRVQSAGELRSRLESIGRGTLAAAIGHPPLFLLLRLKSHSTLAVAMPEAPDEVRRLDVSILHALIFERLLAVPKEHREIQYTIDASAALEAVMAGSADAAFLMNAPSIRDVERVCDAGATMPEKSTYFYPKLLTGLVMNPLSD